LAILIADTKENVKFLTLATCIGINEKNAIWLEIRLQKSMEFLIHNANYKLFKIIK
jgi:hypothetical protein